MSTRVFLLAKEIGVTSKAILEKCRAEEIDVKNHMATLSAGLEATIREWFSEGGAKTAVETAQAVDMEKVRRKPRRKKAEKALTEAELAALPEAPPAARKVPVEAAEPPATVAVAEAPPAEAPAPFEPAALAAPEAPAEAPSQPAATPVAAEAPSQAQVAATTESPAAPSAEEIQRAPQNVPAKAELRGPRVVRIERPEPETLVRPRGARPPSPRRPVPTEAAEDVGPSVGRSPRHRGGVAASAVDTDSESGVKGKGGKRRTRSPRRSARSEAIERIREWNNQDLMEREERLAQATG
ncbi:MAG TPA: hypothetical protein VMW52_13115, partial [Phycisphaerae bacterium]|nr:hypothetical protein [Phycisphaerae bacterium]